LLKEFPALAKDLISYMSIIRSAVPDLPFDTEKMLIQIPDEKVQELLYFLSEASKRKKITLQLQSLCGSLAFCLRALPAGRAISRRLYLACDRARKPHHLIKTTKAMQSDILSMAPRKDHAKSKKSYLPYVTNSLNILLYDVC